MTPGPFAALISDELGQVIARPDGRVDVVLERRLKKPVAKVWAALTVAERIADWFTTVEIDLRLGGCYRIRFEGDAGVIDGVIVELEPERRLAHTWPDADDPDCLVRYELEPDGDGCRLRLTNFAVGLKSLDTAPGWHTFLEALPGACDGVRTAWSAAREREMGERYRDIVTPFRTQKEPSA